MEIRIRQIEGLALAALVESGHWMVMDAEPEVGGSDAGPRPMEVMLAAIAGCSAMDVISILRKKRIKLDGFEVEVKGERAAEHPRRFTRIELKFIVTGRGIDAADVGRAIELSREKYCGATATVRGSAEVIYRYEIREIG